MAGSLQQLLGADGDLADEDFLSAVEDAENRFGTDPHDGDGSVPMGSIPTGCIPTGSIPTGCIPTGSIPTGCIPTGSIPTGSIPTGSIPTGSIPTGPVPPPRLGLRPLSVRDGGPPAPSSAPPQWGPFPQDSALLLATRTDPEGPVDRDDAGGPCKKPRVAEDPAPRGDPSAPHPMALSAGAPHTPHPMTLSAGALQVPHPTALSAGAPRAPHPTALSAGAPRAPHPTALSAGAPRSPHPMALSTGAPRAAAPAAPRLFPAVGGPPRAPAPQPPREAAPHTPVVTNHLVQLVAAASKAPRGGPAPPKRRRFPGPAGILPQPHPGRHLEEILVSAPQTPAHGALAKLRSKDLPSSQPPVEEDFGKGPWVAMKTELDLDERDPSCFLRTYSVVMVLRKAALKQLPKNKVPSMAVMIKSLTRSNVDAGAVFRDPTGEMPGTVHRALLEERRSELKPGSVLLLKQVGVFSPSHRNHYLNVTPNNLLKIYAPESEGSSAQPEQPVVAAWAGLDRERPAQRVPVPKDEGPSRTNSRSSEQVPGGFVLRPGPGQEEPFGAAGCDVDDLDGLLGELPEDFFSAPAQADAC